MKEYNKDLFSLTKEFDGICVTTNNVIDSNGCGVMETGYAIEAAKLWPELPKILGDCLTQSGRNIPFQLGAITEDDKFVTTPFVQSGYCCRIFSFPTKFHFSEKADIALIKESCYYLLSMANALELEYVALPRPGAGPGELSWPNTIQPVISKILDDRFYAIHLDGK